jgi:hypothetical protein
MMRLKQSQFQPRAGAIDKVFPTFAAAAQWADGRMDGTSKGNDLILGVTPPPPPNGPSRWREFTEIS